VLKWQLFQRFCLLVSDHFALRAFPSPLSVRSGNRHHSSDANVLSFRGLPLTGLFKLPFNTIVASTCIDITVVFLVSIGLDFIKLHSRCFCLLQQHRQNHGALRNPIIVLLIVLQLLDSHT
ncbi:unnamed protein product, partial [Brassica rapa]